MYLLSCGLHAHAVVHKKLDSDNKEAEGNLLSSLVFSPSSVPLAKTPSKQSKMPLPSVSRLRWSLAHTLEDSQNKNICPQWAHSPGAIASSKP